MDERYRERLNRAGEAAGAAGLSALLVTPSADLRYLTAYDPPPLERLTCLVIRPGRDPVLVVPELERPLAEGQVPSGVVEIRAWREADDPYAATAEIVGAGERLGVTDQMWAVHVLAIQRAVASAELSSAAPVLGPLRAIKDDQELEVLRRSARVADEAFRRLIEDRFEGLTEREVAGRLAELLVAAGMEQVEFTIVGSGPNAASPHHEAGERGVRTGDGIVLDFGGTVGGYYSDVSRTVAVGELPEGFEEVYEVVAEAQERAVEAVRPGIPAEEVDRAAREVIERAGYGERFIHRTGHGIGLDAHEDPYIIAGNREVLQPGMCFSVEPGIYLEGRFGVRIEDIVTVTEDGVSRLNHAPRELLVVR